MSANWEVGAPDKFITNIRGLIATLYCSRELIWKLFANKRADEQMLFVGV